MKHLAISAALILGVVLAMSQSATAQWEADQRLSSADSGVTLNENMGQCLAANGDSIHVVWCNPHSGGSHIFYRHSFDGGLTWAPDAPIPGTPKNASFPSISVSGANVHVAFRDTTGSIYTTYYVHSIDAGQTWMPAVSLGGYYWWPSITSFANFVYVALNDKHPGNTEVYCRRSTDNGTTWDTVHQISNALGRSEDPSITASGTYVYLAWNDDRSGIMQTWYRSSNDNGVTWGPETQRSHAATFAYFPIIHAVGADVDIANGERLGNTYQIFFMHSSDFGASWTPEAQVTSGASTAAYPTIARNGPNVDMVYSTFGANASYLQSPDGGTTWLAPQDIAPAANKPGSTFIVTVGKTRDIIWLDGRNGFSAVYYKRSTLPSSANFQVPNVFDFGNAKIFLSKDSALILQNSGGAPVSITGYSLQDPKNNFSLRDTSLRTIAASGSGTIKIRFSPTTQTRDSALLTITTDESSHRAYQVLLTGTGIGPLLSVDPAVVNFGKVDSGAYATVVLKLRNYGLVTDTVSGAKISGSAMFRCDQGQFPIVIQAGGSATIVVEFDPTASGAVQGALMIGLNEGSQSMVPLTGIGVGKPAKNGVRAQNALLSNMSISPNPTRISASLRFTVISPLHDVLINYYDEAGRVISTQRIGELSGGEQNIPLTLPKAAGVTFVRVLSGDEIVGTSQIVIVQ